MAPKIDRLCALPKGSKVLVTGANGFIGSHVVNCLLELGYTVHGTVRTPKPWLREFFESRYGPGAFRAVTVPNFDDVALLTRQMEGISGVVHVVCLTQSSPPITLFGYWRAYFKLQASDLTFSTDANAVIPWVVRATQNILKAAASSAVKRVVLTSSSTAALIPVPNLRIHVQEGGFLRRPKILPD